MMTRVPQDAQAHAGDAGKAAPALGRRERKKLATRTVVRDTALRLAVHHGVENITVEQIAAEADIALRTFFNHFSSKEEAVVAASAAGVDALVAAFRARSRTESVLQAIREAVLVVMDQSNATSRDYVEALRLIRREPSLVRYELSILADAEKTLAEAISAHIGAQPQSAGEATAAAETSPSSSPAPGDIYPLLCAAAAFAALRVVLDRWLDQTLGSEAPPLDALRAEIDQALTKLAAGVDRPGAGAEGLARP